MSTVTTFSKTLTSKLAKSYNNLTDEQCHFFIIDDETTGAYCGVVGCKEHDQSEHNLSNVQVGKCIYEIRSGPNKGKLCGRKTMMDSSDFSYSYSNFICEECDKIQVRSPFTVYDITSLIKRDGK